MLTVGMASVDFSSLRKYRVKRLREAMKSYQVDAFLAMRRENVRYMTDYHTCPETGMDMYINPSLLFAQDDEPTLFVLSGDYPWAVRRISWIKDIVALRGLLVNPDVQLHFYEELLRPRLEKAGLTSGRLAVDGLPHTLADLLRKKLPSLEIVDDEPLSVARMIKSEDEIKIIKMATAIMNIAANVALESMKPGRRECEVAGEVARYLFTQNAEFTPWVPQVLTGGNVAPYLRFHTDRIIQRGDPFYFDLGIVYCGYNSCIALFGSIGKPTEEQKELYRVCYEASQAALKMLRPGVTNYEVFAAGERVFEEAGYKKDIPVIPGIPVGDTLLPPSWGMGGMGLGTLSHETPWFIAKAEKNPVKLEKNMVFRVHPQWFKPGVGGGRLKTVAVVREDGPEILTKTFSYGSDIFNYP